MEDDSLVSRLDLRTPSTQISDYQGSSRISRAQDNFFNNLDRISAEEDDYPDDLATIYDDEDGDGEFSEVRPISAPSQASFLAEDIPFDDYYENNNDTFLTNDGMLVEPAYESPNYNVYSLNPRTVPPFFDTTTHRDTYTWKYTIPERHRVDDYDERFNRQAQLPPFEDETTNKATYLPHELIFNMPRWAQLGLPFKSSKF
jgi:hypothetical protein